MEKIININKEKLVTMKYECQDNDALIELSDDKMDLFISIDGETSQTIISLDDLRKSLIQFGIEYLSDTLKHYANERVIEELAEFIQWYSDKKDWYENLNAESGIIIADYQEDIEEQIKDHQIKRQLKE